MMDEDEARSWVEKSFSVPRETMDDLAAFVALLARENEQQNLVSKASIAHVWARHIADSAQLLPMVPPSGSTWLDLGSGAGFPGLIVAALSDHQVTLVEERRLRIEFLRRASECLGVVERATIEGTRVERLTPRPFDVISARAFAPLPRLFELALPFATERTIWVLPKGRNAKSELEAARTSWQGDFRVEPSLTDPDAFIIVAQEVSRRSKGSRSR